MTAIVLHPGFHKTGTSSIQHFLWLNRTALAPHLTIALLRHMKPLVQAAGRYSRSRDPKELSDLSGAIDDLFAAVDPPDDWPLVISCEGLLGRLPGRPGYEDYDAAPELAAALSRQLRQRRPGSPLRILLTTRRGGDWLSSVYRHQLFGTRLTLGGAEFGARYARIAHLEAQADRIAAAAAPVPVERLPLEEAARHPLGPGGAFCARLGLPSQVLAALATVGQGNAGPAPDLWQQFLSLNRSDASDAEVLNEKTRLAKAAGLGGWRVE